MNKSVISKIHTSSLLASSHLFRLLTAVIVLGGLAACAVTPTPTTENEPMVQVEPDNGLGSAIDSYHKREYSATITAFDKIISDQASSANNRRLAHLGKALVYLADDEEMHSLENAKMSRLAASQVVVEGDETFAPETDLLMEAVAAVIGTESKFVVLKAKSGGSGAQIAELKRELDALKSERSELLTEQKVLNEALEKLKELTLAN